MRKDTAVFRQALAVAVSEINQSTEADVSQIKEALRYLILLITHRRSAAERTDLVEVVERYSPTEMEVTHMAQTAAEVLIEQGIEQGARQMSIESTLTILTRRFPGTDVLRVKSRLEAIADLDRLKQLNLTASIAESFPAFREQLEA